MYILSDGVRYIMENPLRFGDYISTTSPVKATEFTYKQARAILRNNKKRYSWVKNYHLIDKDTGKNTNKSLNYRGKSDIYQKESDFDEKILDMIPKEVSMILELTAWSREQLHTYGTQLSNELSRCDSAESDIEHALQTYKERTGGKNPQAHKMAKVGYLLNEIRDRHKRISNV